MTLSRYLLTEISLSGSSKMVEHNGPVNFPKKSDLVTFTKEILNGKLHFFAGCFINRKLTEYSIKSGLTEK